MFAPGAQDERPPVLPGLAQQGCSGLEPNPLHPLACNHAGQYLSVPLTLNVAASESVVSVVPLVLSVPWTCL